MGQGACAADFDNDGFTDLLVTYWGTNSLYRNVQGRRFEPVDLPEKGTRYSTGCVFFDFDRDGDLDLFIANYLQFDFASTPLPGRTHTASIVERLSTADLAGCRLPAISCTAMTAASLSMCRMPLVSGCPRVIMHLGRSQPTSIAMAGLISMSPAIRRRACCI